MKRFRIRDTILIDGFPELGTWVITDRHGVWVTIKPLQESGKVLASLNPCGTVDIRTRDITHTSQQEMLL